MTIEEICGEAKVSKMTLYKFFPNKIELAKVILKKVFDDFEHRLSGRQGKRS